MALTINDLEEQVICKFREYIVDNQGGLITLLYKDAQDRTWKIAVSTLSDTDYRIVISRKE